MSLEYVTGAEFILANDSIGIFVLNTDELPGTARIIVFQNTAGGGVVIADTGVLNVTPTGSVAVGVSLLNGGFYWLKMYLEFGRPGAERALRTASGRCARDLRVLHARRFRSLQAQPPLAADGGPEIQAQPPAPSVMPGEGPASMSALLKQAKTWMPTCVGMTKSDRCPTHNFRRQR